MTNTAARIARPALIAAACLGMLGCRSATTTDVQLRDAQDHSALLGQSVGIRGPLHAGYRWYGTDTDGVAHIRTKRDWDELPIVFAGPGRRIQAQGVLRRAQPGWIALEPAPGDGKRVEAQIVGGEGAAPSTSAQPQD